MSSNVTATENWPLGCTSKYEPDRGLCFSCHVPDYLHVQAGRGIHQTKRERTLVIR